MSEAQLEVENQIRSFMSKGLEVDQVADLLTQLYSTQETTLDTNLAIASFLLNAGLPTNLCRFFSRKIENNNSEIPWGHLVEALFLSCNEVPDKLVQSILDAAKQQNLTEEICKTYRLDVDVPALPQLRRARRQQIWDQHLVKRQDLIERYEMFRSQGLWQEEESLLEQLTKLFPDDLEFKEKKIEFKEKRALELVRKNLDTRLRSKLPHYVFEEFTAEEKVILSNIQKSQSEITPAKEQNVADFAIFSAMLEDWETCIHWCKMGSGNLTCDWLYAEAMLQSRRFVELLEYLSFLESIYGSDPDQTFAILYLRAQALWGLEQKFSAIELLEGLINVRPQYRSALSLLEHWKESST